jgi:hypothetical protein
LLAWLNDEQREHFLRMGLVERITDSAVVPRKLPQPKRLRNASPRWAI